ncbi:MAG TPA: SMP-30/gluconolactonase/LRE family protein [Gillisia sp.]|nr:SMP-30/gluconolactonase/LRE family protein [Gillisia sp.]
MKSFILNTFLIVLLSLPFSMLSQENRAELLRKVKGFSHPESVVLDEKNDVLYISNIGEKETGDGFISKVSPNGEIIELKWIDNLNDPKGLLLVDEILYVTDNTELVIMNSQTGEVTQRIEVTGSSFLNDITVDGEGIIYISDTGKSAIYKRETTGEINEWVITDELEFPNGLLVVEDFIYVAAWGKENPGNVLKVDLTSGQIHKITKDGIGNLDGIQLVDGDGFFVSDWANGKIHRVGMDGQQMEILTSEKSAGDILFLEEKNQLVLPMNLQNAVWWYQLQ